jgi:hypothetical protein
MCRKNVIPNGMRYDYREDPNLNELQLAHIRGEINLYDSIPATKQDWYHDKKGNNHYPIEGTKVDANLPPIYLQWKDDYRKRITNAKR